KDGQTRVRTTLVYSSQRVLQGIPDPLGAADASGGRCGLYSIRHELWNAHGENCGALGVERLGDVLPEVRSAGFAPTVGHAAAGVVSALKALRSKSSPVRRL